MTAAARGSRKSILATGRIYPGPAGPKRSCTMRRWTPPAPEHRIAVVYQLRRARRWLVLLLGGVALALFPWTAYLGATLPGRARRAPLGRRLGRVRPLRGGSARGRADRARARARRCCPARCRGRGHGAPLDAWFDLVTASLGRELRWALLEAVVAELPLAALCYWLALDAAGALAQRRNEPASAAGPRPTSPPDRPAPGREPARTAGSEAPSEGRTSR